VCVDLRSLVHTVCLLLSAWQNHSGVLVRAAAKLLTIFQPVHEMKFTFRLHPVPCNINEFYVRGGVICTSDRVAPTFAPFVP
jgi:hypothetical protein